MVTSWLVLKRVGSFRFSNKQEPFDEWINDLDVTIQARIYAYIDRVAAGASRKNIKPLGSGVFEIILDFGPGYRVYFGETRNIIILLLGGNKGTQAKDIETAKIYWSTYVSK